MDKLIQHLPPSPPPFIDERTRMLGMAIRQALLMAVDAIEVYLNVSPRTSELRKSAK